MFNWFQKKSGLYRLETLGDFSNAVSWLEARRSKGKTDQGLKKYLRSITAKIRSSIDRYEKLTTEVDELCGGVLSSTKCIFPRGAGKIENLTMLQNLREVGGELKLLLDEIMKMDDSRFMARWRRILESRQEYCGLLQKIVGQFGNFEMMLPALPATGKMITNPETQRRISEMYRINTSNLRMLYIANTTYQSWSGVIPQRNIAFFCPTTKISSVIRDMLLEYMVRADPERVKLCRESANKAGREYMQYRFWRAAENLRLMAAVEYIDQQRQPVVHRRYVSAKLSHVPEICTDIRRVEWSIKEILNNALSASSKMYAPSHGVWVAQPLPKHDVDNPDPAISLKLTCPMIEGREWICLTISDEGIGIPREHLPYATFWGYSPRREHFRKVLPHSSNVYGREVQIGGKGIGLAYAREVFREHGGNIGITSKSGEGTRVSIKIPVPTPFAF
ncbi:MAG: ATP-binding protein [Phycisphaerae bacterium]|nr:ATP-binding protein [Phycisphaerae bacterium]